MDFIIRKDIYGSWWHDFNNDATKINISDFEAVIDSVANTFIIQCKNGSNVPTMAISIANVKVINQIVSNTPISFSGAVGLKNLLTSLGYTPYLQATTGSVFVYRVGQVGVFTMTSTQFTTNFDGTGLGINTMIGWALRNGNNGTKNQQGKFSLNKGASPYDVIGASGGSANAVVVDHSHQVLNTSEAGTSLGTFVYGDIGGGGIVQAPNKVSNTGESGTGKNMPPYLIDVWVERVTDLIITTSSGGGGGGAVDSVNGQTGVVVIPLDYLPLAGGTMDDGADIFFDNGSALREGTYDFGGDGGISRICSNQYEDMWQNGFRHVFDQSGFIRNSSNGFDLVPDSSFDVTLRFKVGSFWTLDNGTTYICTDNTEGAAVWEIYHNFIPTLDQVLTENNESTKDAKIGKLFLYDSIRDFFGAIQISNGIFSVGDTTTGNTLFSVQLGIFKIFNTLFNSAFLNFESLTANRTFTFPNKSGTVAMLDDVPSGGGTVTSVDLSMPSAFTVTNNPVTTSGTLTVTGAGAISQYVRGDGSLANFPASSGGGSSLSFYLNGSVSQGTIGGVAFREMDRTPILGAGTDFTINANGYIQSFITDAGVPNQLEIPAGNWNFETYFSASSGGGSPSFYIELYKWNGTTLSLIASNSANPEFITGGTNTDLYVSALAVPQTTLLATDRLAVRIYVTHSGRTIKLHTENSNLCQVITTFSTGLTALNGLTSQVQNLATGTSGTDFGIVSSGSTHTFNLPNASAANRGLLTSSDWSAFNSKLSDAAFQFTRRLIANGTGSVTGTTAETIITSLTIPANTLDSKCFIWTTMDYSKTSSGSCTLRLYVNSSNSLSGATQIGLATIGSNRNLSFNRKLYLNGTTLDFLLSTTTVTQANNEFGEAIFGASTTTTVNPANDIFLIYTTTNDAVGTLATAKQATVQKLKLN